MKVFIILLCVLISSCLGSEFQRVMIFDNYFVITTDNYNRDIYLGYKLETDDFVGIVSSKIVEVKKNGDFIIAKQSTNKDKSKINYFIIKRMAHTNWPENGVFGPFSEGQFELKMRELGLKNSKFEMVFEAD